MLRFPGRALIPWPDLLFLNYVCRHVLCGYSCLGFGAWAWGEGHQPPQAGVTGSCEQPRVGVFCHNSKLTAEPPLHFQVELSSPLLQRKCFQVKNVLFTVCPQVVAGSPHTVLWSCQNFQVVALEMGMGVLRPPDQRGMHIPYVNIYMRMSLRDIWSLNNKRNGFQSSSLCFLYFYLVYRDTGYSESWTERIFYNCRHVNYPKVSLFPPQRLTLLAIFISTFLFSLTWQFNQFMMLLQALVLFILDSLDMLPAMKVSTLPSSSS